MDSEEKNLILRARQNDTRAFEMLMQRHDRRILQLLYSMLGNLADAQDAFQETFLRAYTGLSGYRFDGEFGGWLSRIAVNQAINRRRQRSRRRLFSLDSSREDGPTGIEMLESAAETGPENRLLQRETREIIRKAVDRLPPKQQAVFTLKHIQGYKISEIAGMLECAEGTVKNYLFRAVRGLRKQLERQDV